MRESWRQTQKELVNLQSQLQCSICHNLPVNPYILWCKHSYCKDCILPLKNCPDCNFFIVAQELAPNIILKQILSLISVTSEAIISDESPSKLSSDSDHPLKTKAKLVNVTEHTSAQCNNILNIMEKHGSTEKENTCQIDNNYKTTTNQLDILSKRRIRERSTSLEKKQLSISNSLPINKATSTNVKRKKCSNQLPGPSNKTQNEGFVSPSFKNTIKKTIVYSAKKTCESNKVNKRGETPLHIVCRQGKLKLVEQLLQEGAQPNVKDYANWTPLCDAVSLGKIDVVKALLQTGASVNTPCHQNTTPLIEAVVRKNEPMTSLLLSYGADIHQRSSLDNTAWSLANDELKNLMKNAKNVPVMKHPFIKTSPKTVTPYNIPEEDISSVKSFCEHFNVTLSTTFIDETTHVVVHKTAANTCKSSAVILQAILNGCCVVGVDWIAACVQAGYIVPVDDYEPSGTDDIPHSSVFFKARRNREQMLPKLFDGCHISLQQGQTWPASVKEELVNLVMVSGAQYQPRECDPERIPLDEQTVMFHTTGNSSLAQLSHVILYQPTSSTTINHITYNMAHTKSLPVSWFKQSIKTFSISL